MRRFLEGRHFSAGRLVPVIGFSLCFYFMWPLLQGERSYVRLMALEHETAATTGELDQARTERQALEKKVIGLRPGSIDRDLLDERARAMLGYRQTEEKVVIAPATSPAPEGSEKP